MDVLLIWNHRALFSLGSQTAIFDPSTSISGQGEFRDETLP